MYLQSIELIGFKSFAHKTRLLFEPGITAIVGPNGCGKSNISDAIRWVLGEQRPTALRSAAMTDVIFNGTDAHKPVGMTEVSITFAECEAELGTDYHAVTVTRRVFRTGEGHYYLNKTPCRLRDIQRLFMGTGIGTTSYSVMAQGQIDAILSSKPEDRRAIFEEASGITRFRADRREAMRKLDQTDANLLRLNDVIRELHRQIGSLQRQAGKARRYKELQGELRQFDLHLTGRRVVRLRESIDRLGHDLARMARTQQDLHEHVEAGEACNATARARLMEDERRIGTAMETAMEAQGRCNQTADAIRVNEQRISEYAAWTERDRREISETEAVRDAQEAARETCETQRVRLDAELAEAETALAGTRHAFDAARHGNTVARNALQQLRNESVEAERRHVGLQNDLTNAENAARESLLRNERLLSEKNSLQATAASLAARLDEREAETDALNDAVETDTRAVADGERRLDALNATLRETERALNDLHAQIAVQQARILLLCDPGNPAGGAPAGHALLLDAANPLDLPAAAVIGPLAEQFSAPKAWRAALEAVLRAWTDAVVIRTDTDASLAVDRLLAADHPAGARMMVAEPVCAPKPAPPPGLPRLLDHLSCAPAFQTAAEILLGHVFVIDTLEARPSPHPDGCAFVTPDGAVVFPNGLVELHMPGGDAADPLSRHLLAEDARAEVAAHETLAEETEARADALRGDIEIAAIALQTARNRLEASRRTAAQREGEERTLRGDLTQARTRLAAVEQAIAEHGGAADTATVQGREIAARIRDMADARQRLADAANEQAEAVQEAEAAFLEAQTHLTEARLSHASISHRAEGARSQHAASVARIAELERMIQSRQESIRSCEAGIARLTAENETLRERLDALARDAETHKVDVARLRDARTASQTELETAERSLLGLRRALDEASEAHGKTEVALAEARMRLQNIQDRLMIDWHLPLERLADEPTPDWEEPPTEAEAEARVADIRSKMEAMGPVNLVAIEEYQEIEERHAFLTAQEADLTGAKTRLLDLIRDIDKQSSERFKETFEKAKANFQTMFQRLFDGGTAELALLDETDMLECGIDIIARPPGKKPQGISLLSGGERTLTAVALLFAIYMIKPSPFAMLDELDAALDDSNIGRFVAVLKDFLSLSQFLIITHNQHTIAGADIVYGVTQQEQGISQIVSMRLKRIGVADPQGEAMPEVAAPPPIKRRKKKNEHESL